MSAFIAAFALTFSWSVTSNADGHQGMDVPKISSSVVLDGLDGP